MRARLPSLVAMTLAASSMCGCYPALLTSRPKGAIVVTDEAGAPLQGVTVTLATTEWHGIVGPTTLDRFTTDEKGVVGFGTKHEWATQVMLPDGDISYSWSLCFSKAGFEAIPMTSPDFDQPIEVGMYSSTVSSECEWTRLPSRPRVKEREARWIEVEGGNSQSGVGVPLLLDEIIRGAMEASAREQGIKLRSWSEYRFQYQARGEGTRDHRLLVHAFCRAPADFDLAKAFYSEADDNACFFETTYTTQTYTDQPKPAFGPLQIVAARQ